MIATKAELKKFEKEDAGGVLVEALKKGFHGKVRAVGEKFRVPVRADGKEPSASWYKVVKSAKQVAAEDAAKGKADAEAKAAKLKKHADDQAAIRKQYGLDDSGPVVSPVAATEPTDSDLV